MTKKDVPPLYRSNGDYDGFHHLEDEREEIRNHLLETLVQRVNIKNFNDLVDYMKECDAKFPNGWRVNIHGFECSMGIRLDLDSMEIRSEEYYDFFMSGVIRMPLDYVKKKIVQINRESKLKEIFP